MRNLKKILALVLALVMSLSLMATAGASSFQDVTDDNPYKTAIDILDELKVFQGFEDGSFKPTDTLNRAQAAVLVYRIATGDVENKYLDNYTYMQQSKFTDLDGYNWAKGYINYCQNAGIVVGTTTTTFEPGKQVTGYQLLVMLLRTLGYGKAGEFTDPKGWELQTATIAEREGILKNVTGGDFGAPAPRQMVAEILFRGLLHDTVEYSPLTPGGYTDSGVTLGKKNLDLDDIEGVVVANHIADLYDTEPMKDGQTRMIVDGKDYVIDMDTEATAIGLNHHAYVQNGKVLGSSLEAEGNVIGEPEHGEAAKVSDLAKDAGIKLTKETEHYVNFDQYINGYSKWRLEYTVQFDDIDDQAKFEARIGLDLDDVIVDGDHDGLDKVVNQGYDGAKYTRAIPRNRTITPQDITIMEGIFTYASGDTDATDFDVKGSVYAGTNNSSDANVNRNKDLAAVMTWDDFYDEYILGSKTEVTASDNGEWLRVIDNDGDGVVDYVLRTDFVMTTITDYEKRTDVYDVEWMGGLPNGNGEGKIPASAIIKASEDTDLSVGSVILYTLIDGNYYVSNPAVETLTIDKKSIDSKQGTFTSDSETYTWSGIDEKAERYYDSVSQLSYATKYDMYPDHFGFIRLATETSRNFVLLTDGYYATDNRNSEYKADLYDGETAVYDVKVNDHARSDDNFNGDGFIDTWENDHSGNRSTWLRLNTFGEFYWLPNTQDTDTAKNVHYTDKAIYNYTSDVVTWTDGSVSYTGHKDPFYTNIALGSENESVWTLEDVTDLDVEYNGLYRDYNAYVLAGATDFTFGFKATDLWGVTSWTGNTANADQAIQTNGRTIYYYVENPGKHGEDLKVQSWVGYQNAPEDLEKAVALRGYAVTHEIWNDGAKLAYELADVVVIEGTVGKDVENPQLIINGVTSKREIALGRDGEGVYGEHDTEFGLFTRDQLKAIAVDENGVPYGKDGLVGPQVSFYDPNDEEYIVDNFADYGIYAGIVTVAPGTKNDDYVEITASGSVFDKRIPFHTDNVPVFELDQNTNYNGNATKNLDAEKQENIKLGDQLIVMCDGDGKVQLVVNVSRSGKDGKTYRNADGSWSDNMIVKLVELHEAIIEDQDPANAGKTASEKIAAAKAVFDRIESGDAVQIWEMEEALKDLKTITPAEKDELLVSENVALEEMLDADDGLPAKITEAVEQEGRDNVMAAVKDAAVDAIIEIIGDSWDELPEGVETVDDLLKYDFAADADLDAAQKTKIANILTRVTSAQTASDAVQVSAENKTKSAAEQAESISAALEKIKNNAQDAIWAECGVSEVEPGTMVPSGVPAGVTVEKRAAESEKWTDDHENVESEYEVTIPSSNTGTEIKFELAVPAGQTPYAPANQTNVTSVDFTLKPAQTLAMVSADVYGVTITLKRAETETTVEILLLEEGDEPVEVPLTIDVEAVTARLWDTAQGTDSGDANNLYSSYSVSMTEDTTKENTWNVSIKANDVVKHANASNTKAYWVGVAFLPTASKGEVTDATLYIADNTGALAADTGCTFGPAMIEVAGGKGEDVENLIAEYFGCGADSNADFSKTYKVVVQWTVTDAEGAETTVRHTYNVSVEITKQLTADPA